MYSECSRPETDERKERGCRRRGSYVEEDSGSRVVKGGAKVSVVETVIGRTKSDGDHGDVDGA